MGNKMKNVLVFPAGTEIGLEIERALRDVIHFRVFGATSLPDHSQYTYERMTDELPMFSDPTFADRLGAILAQHDIDLLFPAHDDLVALLPQLKAEGRLPEKVRVVTSPAQTAALARSKRATYAALSDVIDTPHCFDPGAVSAQDLPLFAKPDRGQGSKGARRIDTLDDAKSIDPDMILSEYLPGDEYTIDCFTDRHANLRFVGGRERSRTSNGISVASHAYSDPEFEVIAQAINAKIQLRGAWFFQLKRRADGTPVLLEIAPRIAGGMGFCRAQGINLPLLALYDQMDLDVDIFANDVALVRDCALAPAYEFSFEFETVYVDLDDTLIFGDRTNAALVGLLYHWRNQGKSLVLLTRHQAAHGRDPRKTLDEHHISAQLFTDVVDVPQGARKSAYITEQKAIFIDDSASERRDVHLVNKIPTFTCNQACEVLSRSKGNFV